MFCADRFDGFYFLQDKIIDMDFSSFETRQNGAKFQADGVCEGMLVEVAEFPAQVGPAGLYCWPGSLGIASVDEGLAP